MRGIRHRAEWAVAAVAVSVTCASGASATPAQVERAVRYAHASWFAALLSENVVNLEALLAKDVTLSFPGGNLMPRQEFLSLLKAGELSYEKAEHEDMLVRLYGEETGVVTGRSNLAYTFKGSRDFERLRYTAVYARVGGEWRLVAWQSTLRPEQ